MTTDWKLQWIEAVSPDEPQKLLRRLEWDDLSEDLFQSRLHNSQEQTDIEENQWRTCLADCQKALMQAWDLPLLPVDTSDEQKPFEDLWHPIRLHASNLLKQELIAVENHQEDVIDQLCNSLISRLCSIGEQVLWECFNNERSPGMMLLAHLGNSGDGSGPPVRTGYECFIRKHRKDGLKLLLVEFPELGRFIGTVVMLWLQSNSDMLNRIQNDRDILERVFSIPDDCQLHAIQQGLSDPHRGGRAVSVLEFLSDNDSTRKVVYKPKDMAVDVAYQNVLKDLNENSDSVPLRQLAIQAMDGYGYMEYVPHRFACNDLELEQFYVNAGRLSAVLHILGCTDCHHENLIACGDQLLLIDTETLLEAEVPDHISNQSTVPTTELSDIQKRFQQSVLRSGLLPQWMFMGRSKLAIDISAFGMEVPSKKTQNIPGWLGLNSDGMMMGRVEKVAEVPTSLPVGIGINNPFQRFLEVFCQGFEQQCHALIKRRDNWLKSDGVLSRFQGLRRRIVLRATRVYFLIQRQQLEPVSLRHPLNHSLRLEQLAKSFLLAESKPLHWPVFASEVRQMQQLDIPFFTHAIDSNVLDLDEDATPLSEYIGTSGLNAARHRLSTLNNDEIAFQLKLIRGACNARQLKANVDNQIKVQIDGQQYEHNISQDVVISRKQISMKLMDVLLNTAIHDSNGQVEWMGMDLGADGDSFSFGPVGMSLYGGAIGIAVLANRLNAVYGPTADRSDLQTAILQPLSELIFQSSDDQRLRWWRDQSLGLSGCGGIMLGLQTLGRRSWVDTLVKSARSRFIEADQQHDLIGGCSGLIGPMLRQSSDQAVDVALLAGNHLLKQQQDDGSWPAPGAIKERPGLLGFSHGTAGHAAALAHLHRVTGEQRFLDGAYAALKYERSNYRADAGNWPDFRNAASSIQDPDFMTSWCHGAPGIGLARACLWSTALWDDKCHEEISIAMLATAEAASRDVFQDHLCCGNVGLMVILEALMNGPWALDQSIIVDARDKIALIHTRMMNRFSGNSIAIQCFNTKESNLMLPGFFTGLSGIGMAFLEDQESRQTTFNLISAGLWNDPKFNQPDPSSDF